MISVWALIPLLLLLTLTPSQEPDNPVDDEDPYATVEFVPKSKRKPPRPKVKESTGDGVYATITDIKENPWQNSCVAQPESLSTLEDVRMGCSELLMDRSVYFCVKSLCCLMTINHDIVVSFENKMLTCWIKIKVTPQNWYRFTHVWGFRFFF